VNKAERIAEVLPKVEGLLTACCLCGHRCGVNRLANEPGRCRTDSEDARHARCASHTLHFGEEPPLAGRGGSGTVFFTHCNLRCVFCQNHQISQEGMGNEFGPKDLARLFL